MRPHKPNPAASRNRPFTKMPNATMVPMNPAISMFLDFKIDRHDPDGAY